MSDNVARTKSGQRDNISCWHHVHLYAKGWYRRMDVIEDLKRIQEAVTGCPSDGAYGLISILAGLVQEEADASGRNVVEGLLDRIFTGPDILHLCRYGSTSEDMSLSQLDLAARILDACLAMLRFSSLPLDCEPDPAVLPLFRRDGLDRWQRLHKGKDSE